MKKCPYCAEEIQDEAIVCRYCGSDIPRTNEVSSTPFIPKIPSPAKKGMKKSVKITTAIAIVVVICLCSGLTLTYKYGQQIETKTAVYVSTQQKVRGLAAQTSVAHNLTLTPATVTITPRPMLGMDLAQFQSTWESMTDIQRKAFIDQSVGKWVDWSGEINGVESDGRIVVNIPGELMGAVDVTGIPQSVLIDLSKGQTIHFIGQITGIVTVIGPFIAVANAQTVP